MLNWGAQTWIDCGETGRLVLELGETFQWQLFSIIWKLSKNVYEEPLIPGQRFCFKKHLKLQRRRLNTITLKSDSRVFMVAFMDSLEKLHIPKHFVKNTNWYCDVNGPVCNVVKLEDKDEILSASLSTHAPHYITSYYWTRSQTIIILMAF